MSSGGLRSDFRVMLRRRSAPGADLTFLLRGLGIFGSMYCVALISSRH